MMRSSRSDSKRFEQYDELAQKIYGAIAFDPNTRYEVSPIINAHATHSYTSGVFTVPGAYESTDNNTVQLELQMKFWGNLTASHDDSRIDRIVMKFGTTAQALTTYKEEPEGGLTIDLSREDITQVGSTDKLRYIAYATQAMLASMRDDAKVYDKGLRQLVDARITNNYKMFTVDHKAIQAINDTRPVAKVETAVETPQDTLAAPNNSWKTYSDEPVRIATPPKKSASPDELANVRIVTAASRSAPANTTQIEKEQDIHNNGYSMGEFASRHDARVLSRERREIIARLAQVQANRKSPDTIKLSGDARQLCDMLVVNGFIDELPAGYDASLYELLLTEQAYTQTLAIHPEWFVVDGIGVDEYTPRLYWVTGAGNEIQIGANTSRIPYDETMQGSLGFSNHIGLRNMAIQQVMPFITKLENS